MRTVLAPIDFSEASQRVANVAAGLARALNGRVLLLHVVRPPHLLTGLDVEVENVAEMTVAMEKAAEGQLSEFKKTLEEKSVETQTLRLTGHAAAEIFEQAQKLSADYIVIGSHGHTAFYDLIVGSTTSAVIKRSRCPVIVVPPIKRSSSKPQRRSVSSVIDDLLFERAESSRRT
jgi:nucleotide-binding universal stress UspA family protein